MNATLLAVRPVLAWALAAAATTASSAAAEDTPVRPDGPATASPNIVFVLFDDLGFGESPSFRAGCEFKTPNLDRLAREGMRFLDAHSAAAVCTPTRYGILTGRYPLRIGQYGVLDTFSPPIIRADELTVGGFLRSHGYHTGCFGKWHLGMRWPESVARDTSNAVPIGTVVTEGPLARGFDTFVGFTHSRNMRMIIDQDRVAMNLDQVDVQPLVTDRAAAFVTERAATGKPFFLYLPLAAPHTPVVPDRQHVGRSGAGLYGDWILQGDAALGRILTALDAAGIADRTLVIVTSDNGASGRSYPPLRGAKTSIYEGGHRVPFVVRWPGAVEAGSTCKDTICLNDLLATCADIVGAELPADAGVDSFTILPLLGGQARDPAREVTIHQSPAGDLAIRKGPWKLISFPRRAARATAAGSDARENGRELYNLGVDIGEQRNLASTEPEVVAELAALLDTYISAGRGSPRPFRGAGPTHDESSGAPAKQSGRP